MLFSKAASIPPSGRKRNVLFIDVKKAHLNQRCEQDVCSQLAAEVNAKPGRCGNLVFWLYGFRPAAQAWENMYAKRFEVVGFVRGLGTSVAFHEGVRDLVCVVHGDDFTSSCSTLIEFARNVATSSGNFWHWIFSLSHSHRRKLKLGRNRPSLLSESNNRETKNGFPFVL